jgi:IclR family pca regulon transcriptional regulator
MLLQELRFKESQRLKRRPSRTCAGSNSGRRRRSGQEIAFGASRTSHARFPPWFKINRLDKYSNPGVDVKSQSGESRFGNPSDRLTQDDRTNNHLLRTKYFSQSEKQDAMPSPKRRAVSASKSAASDDTDRLRSTVQSLAKGFRILEAFTADNEEMTLSEIALKSALDPGTTFRMLNTLVELGYVAKVPDSRRFSLTLRVLDLGFHAIAHKDLRDIVRPVLRALVNDTSEAASFAVLNGAEVLYIERVRAGIARLGVDIRIGTTVPAHQTIIGHTMLAFLPPADLARLSKITPRQTISALRKMGWNDIQPSLASIRQKGYALRDSTLSEGLRILGVPVLDPDGLAVGAISIAAPAARISADEFRKRALKSARASARDIARALEAGGSIGFSP